MVLGAILGAAKIAAPFVLPALSGLFGNQAKPKSAEEMLKILRAQFGEALAPAIQGAIQQGQAGGRQVAQSFGAAAGRAGGLRTGVGAVGTGLATSAAGARASDARFRGAQAISQLSAAALPGALQNDIQGLPFQTGRLENLIGSLGQFSATTKFDPTKALINAGVRLFGTQRSAPNLQAQAQAQQNQGAPFGQLQGGNGPSTPFGKF